MITALRRSPAGIAIGLASVAILAACASEVSTSPRATPAGYQGLSQEWADEDLAVCHKQEPGSDGRIIEVEAPALDAHLAHGDYVSRLVVRHSTDQFADSVHFNRITDALRAARDSRLARGELTSAACRITIVAAAGVYAGTVTAQDTGTVERFPLVVDVPDITLRGALVMELDEAGRATGAGAGDSATTLSPVEPLPIKAGSSTPIILANAHPGGSAGHGLIVEGFVFQSGRDAAMSAGGQGVLAIRVNRFAVRGNRFETGFTESIDVRSGSGVVVENYLGGIAGTGSCDICLAGPGYFRAAGNRLLAGGIPGIVASGVVGLPVPSGVEPLSLPATAETWALIHNNEVRNHLRLPVGTGIRVDALGVGAPNVYNTVNATIRNNLVVNNRFGLIVHGGFPIANTARRSDVNVTYGGNVIQQSCQAKLLVALTRHQTALGLNVFPYLVNSHFQIALRGDVPWSEVWFGHDAGYGNTLVVDGQTIATGSRQFYSGAGCPGL